MEEPARIRKTPFVILGIVVCLASVLLGILFGFLAAAGYLVWHGDAPGMRRSVQILLLTGSTTGGVGGLIAGLVWCRAVFHRSIAGESGRKLTGTGGKWGLIVGVATTVVLHSVLITSPVIITLLPATSGILQLIGIGLVCGAVAGGVLGLLSGAVWAWLAKRAMRHGFPVDVEPPAAE